MRLVLRSARSLLVIVIAALAINTANAGPCDTDAHRQFDFWIGTWRVQTPDGKEVATSKIEREYGGCVIHERYEAGSGYSGESLNIFDAKRGVWHQTWVDNGGALAQLEGGIADGKMVLEGQAVGPNGQPRTNRITWTPNPDGTVRQHWEVKEAEGAWTTAFDGRYTRK